MHNYMYVPYLLVNRAMAHTEQTSFDRIDPCQDLKMRTSSSDRVWQFRQKAKQMKSIFSWTKLLDSIDAVYSGIELWTLQVLTAFLISLSLCLWLCLCLCLSLSVCLCLCLCLCLSVCLSVWLSFSLSVCLSVSVSVYVSLSLSVCLSVCLSAILLSVLACNIAILFNPTPRSPRPL